MDVKLGKKAKVEDGRTLKLANYMGPAGPPPPVSVAPPTVDSWPMYSNDQKADCTCAAAGHMVTTWTALEAPVSQGKITVVKPPETDVLTLYSQVNGGTDGGAVALDVLNAWRHTGLGADKIAGFAELPRTGDDGIRRALWLFGGAYAGLQLPRTAQTEATWDVGPNGLQGDAGVGSWGGHAVNVIAYDVHGLTIVTWGRVQLVTWAFWDAYCDECYAVWNSTDWLGDVPGFDAATLNLDLSRL